MAEILLLDTMVEMQGSLGTSASITAISQASEAVVTVTHSLSVGDLVVINGVSGMTQINRRVVRVGAITGTTDFTCEDLDSTNFSAYVSGGTMEPVATLLSFDNATSFSFPEPTPNRIDVTTIHDTEKKEIFGLDDAPQITIPMKADPFAPHVAEMRVASLAKTTRAFRVTLQTGQVLIMNAFVAGGRGLDGSVGGVGTAQASLTLAAGEQWFVS